MKKTTVFTLIVLTLITFSCKTRDMVYLKEQLQNAMLTGKVISDEGLPLEGVTVKLNDVQKTETDINGKFLFNYIRFGKYTISFSKDGYSVEQVPLVFNFRNRKLPGITVKLFSTNYLMSEAFELLKEKEYDEVSKYLEQLQAIAPNDETIEYLQCVYLIETGDFDKALELAEDLKKRDRSNIYYQLTLASIYEHKQMYEELANLYEYIGKNDIKKHGKYIVKAADIYITHLEKPEESNRLSTEYPALFTNGTDN
jgi:tetratricopeptide (TPR) repeat protein